jgi:ubiquinone/menaquinone biosynthesis C-methylase UbiE
MSSASASAQQAGPQPAERLLQLATGYMVSSALYGVTSLAIPDLLKAGSKSVAELAISTGTHEDALYRILRALASIGVFEENPARTFSLTPLSEPLCAGGPDSMRAMALWLSDPFHMQVYGEVPHALRTGETVSEKLYGVSCFDYFAQNKEVGDRFNNAMTGFSATVIASALETYDFGWLEGKTVVDVAGGHGMVLTEILKKVPGARGVLFDLEHVVRGATERIESQGLAGRCSTAHGDFFEAVPEGDAYVMKHVIHDWDDARAATILRNIHRAARPGSRVVLIEAVLAPGNAPHFAKWIDIEMLMLPGGRERTEVEYRSLFEATGFRLTRVVPNKSPLSVVEAVRVDS